MTKSGSKKILKKIAISGKRLTTTVKVLFIGDIVQRIGRKAVAKILPDLKKELKIDFIIANGENSSSGNGMTEKSYNDLLSAGVDFITSGNHIFKKKEFAPLISKKGIKVIRPANYPEGAPGKGYAVLKVKDQKIGIINMSGNVHMLSELDSPFRKIEETLKKIRTAKIKIVDFHADVSSEKVAFGLYLDGKVSAVIGTHTHVPTADERVTKNGTALVTDAGMVGPKDSSLGVKKEVVIERFITGLPRKHEIAEEGLCVFNSVLMEIDANGKAKSIKRIDREVSI